MQGMGDSHSSDLGVLVKGGLLKHVFWAFYAVQSTLLSALDFPGSNFYRALSDFARFYYCP